MLTHPELLDDTVIRLAREQIIVKHFAVGGATTQCACAEVNDAIVNFIGVVMWCVKLVHTTNG